MTDVICWLDLETSGSRDYDAILEIGIALTTQTPELEIVKTFSKVVRPALFDSTILPRMDPVVVEMHTNSGLFDDIYALPHPDYQSQVVKDTEEEVLKFLVNNTDYSKKRVPLAGSGVSHFDRKYVKRDWPSVDEFFTYWAYDVGAVRRYLRLSGVTLPKHIDKPHRALNDVLLHIEEARTYMKAFKGLKLNDSPRF